MKRNILTIICIALSLTASGQRVSILGDSYSTFEDFVTPSSNELWYYAKNDTSKTDVNRVQDTWWWQFVHDNGMKLEINNSYSGATIGYGGYDGNDYSARSFLRRMYNIGSPDILLVFGATNDSWSGEQVGEYKYCDWTWGDFYNFRPAMAYMVNWIKLHHPNVRVYYIINSDLRKDITESMKVICRHYGVPYIQLENIDKKNGHPTVKGMKAIAEQVGDVVNKQNDN